MINYFAGCLGIDKDHAVCWPRTGTRVIHLDGIPASPLTRFLILEELLPLSRPLFPYLQSGQNSSVHFRELVEK